jgi:L-lysine 2,3-aminomutase
MGKILRIYRVHFVFIAQVKARCKKIIEEEVMKTLKLVPKSKADKIQTKHHKNRPMELDDDLIELFPQSRYFQVHFQHMHENTHELKSELAKLRDYVATVDKKLEQMMVLLSHPHEPAL